MIKIDSIFNLARYAQASFSTHLFHLVKWDFENTNCANLSSAYLCYYSPPTILLLFSKNFKILFWFLLIRDVFYINLNYKTWIYFRVSEDITKLFFLISYFPSIYIYYPLFLYLPKQLNDILVNFNYLLFDFIIDRVETHIFILETVILLMFFRINENHDIKR